MIKEKSKSALKIKNITQIKVDRKIQILLLDITYMWNLTKQNSKKENSEKQSRKVEPRAWGVGENRKSLVKGYKLSAII